MLMWRSMEEKRSAFRKMTEVRSASSPSGDKPTQLLFTDGSSGTVYDIRFQKHSDCDVRRPGAATGYEYC